MSDDTATLLEDVTLSCPEPGCGWTVTAPARGRGSAPFRLGTHAHVKHKTKTAAGKPTRPKAGAPSDEERAARPVLSAVRDSAAQIGAGLQRPPSGEELAKGFGRGLGLVSIMAASTAIDRDPRISTDEQAEAAIDYLSVPPDAATQIMRPIGKALSGTSLNKRYGRGIVDNVDVLASLAELGTIVMHWRRYFADLNTWKAEQNPAPAGLAPVPADVPTATQNGQTTTPPPQTGHVVTPEQVQAMHAARANGGTR